MSSSVQVCYPLIEGHLEKYGKRLIGRNDMEDALRRLDKLTQEEARMAVAENLKATHTVNERVRGVANTVVAIDNRVARVDDKVEGIASDVDRVKRSSYHPIRIDLSFTHHFRRPITRKHPQMALPSRSIN